VRVGISILLVLGLLSSCSNEDESLSLSIISFNEDWKFSGEGLKSEFINIPHTPRIEPLIVNDQWQGNLTYLKNLTIDDPQLGKTFLHFEGVMHDATAFINDVKIKRHVGGYLPFSVDITDHLRKGENQIRIEVSNTDDPTIPPGKPLEGLDFNYYGGIYRDVWLIRKNEIYVTDPFIEDTKEAGWLLHFDEVSTDQATGVLKVQLKNESNSDKEVIIKATLRKGDLAHSFEEKLQLESLEVKSTSLAIDIQNPFIWSTTSPNLYQLTIEINSNNGTYDLVEDKIGIRQIELNDDGFLLNGEKQFIRGTNRHQEYPYVGYAISNNANFRDALKIKNAGFDFVRLSHYPQDEAFLDACDELGILVMNAIPGWQFFQEGEFVENSYQDIKDMVRRDRNHPSVIFWEVSLNESGMTAEYMEKANQILKEELPFKDTYSAGWIDHPSYDLFIPARQHSGPPNYWNDYKVGDRKVFIGEYGDWEYYAHNAGFNQTAFSDLSEDARNSRQLRSSGERGLLQQALNFQEAANSNRKAGKGTIGHANWLMFDYNRGYADDLEASGISDIFRIPKFAYYFYKSQRPSNEIIDHPLIESGPMVKIASYWTEKSPLDIRVFGNCEEVALYLNDSLIEKKRATKNELSNKLISPPFHFDVSRFQPGNLTAIGFVGGEDVTRDTVSTPGKPHAIRLRVDYSSDFYHERDDLVFIYAEVVDPSGIIIPNDSSEIHFKLNSSGKLIGENPIKTEAGIASILFRGSHSLLDIDAHSSDLRETNYHQ
jgi:beta-galactosidase